MNPFRSTAWAYLGVLATMMVLDGVWLGLVARNFYKAQFGDLMRDPPNLVAAAAFYLLYSAGMVLFVVKPALVDGGLMRAMVLGAALGFIAYMTYDLTNLATLRGWSTTLVAADLAWGTVISAAAGAGGWALARRMAG